MAYEPLPWFYLELKTILINFLLKSVKSMKGQPSTKILSSGLTWHIYYASI